MARVTILSHSERFYTTRRLLAAGAALGHQMASVDPVSVAIALSPSGPRLIAGGAVVRVPEVVIPRIGVRLARWSGSLLGAWIAAGAYSAVTPEAIARAGDKLATSERLLAAGLPILPTVAIREPGHVEQALSTLGGDAWVLKRRRGSGGDGVVLVRGFDCARSALEAWVGAGHTALVQPYVALDPVRDLRVLVLGGEPTAAAWRHAAPGEFRANVHRGGRPVAAELTSETRDLAARAAAASELACCGVDLLETPTGWVVLEVNASPSLEGIEAATGRDLATPYVAGWVAGAPRHIGS
ncbi:MAG: 30S ribosomal protein S6--L-glutamate ligase [Deltaproteobacteria bacterium HGW-Deltaproteobacteria-14]|jgi:ribosomal protein S6--L-glutamate ligase|nr:MAG: 30S ribosomal protein S6--L-glutamate ligase [Deltaproteobacteria bacterium HGW-Deltaproteobacteria-14]